MSKKRVTLRDVADRAGVSRTTASNLVRGTGRASQETRDRVFAVMEELGYVYNRAAGSLRGSSSRTVGVVITNIHRAHFGELLVGLEQAFTEAGYTLFVVSTMDQLERQERALGTLREHNVDGLVIVPATGSDQSLIDLLEDWGVPNLFVSRWIPGIEHPYVGIDNEHGAYVAAQHLLEHGCRDLAYIGSNPGISIHLERVAGVRRALKEWPDEARLTVIEGETTSAGGYRMTAGLVQDKITFDGLIGHGDLIALGAARALRDLGMSAPGEPGSVRVIGYDGVDASAYWQPALTTLAVNADELGQLAAESLVTAIETGAEVESRRPQPSLMVRESCGPHPSAQPYRVTLPN
ncbi:LacI family DNA-binding transcriptional regulator [Microlunatus sp. GCM10028923]|uniref:LacI family DNA-binding transcriptional regulator n=1 Tax=Microlunatus sp. GCM10028923 TaxID=3273400 RepID=UPI00361F1088